MTPEPGIDFPDELTPVDVLAASRGDVLISFVERVDGSDVLVTVGQDRFRRPVRLEPGERLEVVWKGPDELRAVPAELVAVERGAEPTWRLRPVGPATRGQRRAAVRAPLAFRVSAEAGGQTLEGRSLDISEAGIRCLLDGGRVPAEPAATGWPGTAGDLAMEAGTPEAQHPRDVLALGAVLAVTVWFDDRDYVSSRGEVVRRHDRPDGRDEFSVRFIGLPEKAQDHIRAKAFLGLRDLQKRGIV